MLTYKKYTSYISVIFIFSEGELWKPKEKVLRWANGFWR